MQFGWPRRAPGVSAARCRRFLLCGRTSQYPLPASARCTSRTRGSGLQERSRPCTTTRTTTCCARCAPAASPCWSARSSFTRLLCFALRGCSTHPPTTGGRLQVRPPLRAALHQGAPSGRGASSQHQHSLARARAGGRGPCPPRPPLQVLPVARDVPPPPPPPFPNHALGRRLWHDRQFLLLAVRAGRGCPQRRVTGGGARRSETVVGEGEGITIPAGHWHYVRALTPSLSVNFWWRKAGGSGGAGGAGERA